LKTSIELQKRKHRVKLKFQEFTMPSTYMIKCSSNYCSETLDNSQREVAGTTNTQLYMYMLVQQFATS